VADSGSGMEGAKQRVSQDAHLQIQNSNLFLGSLAILMYTNESSTP